MKMKMHVWERVEEPGTRRDGMRWTGWRCDGCGSSWGRNYVRMSEPGRPTPVPEDLALAGIPLDCDEALVKLQLES